MKKAIPTQVHKEKKFEEEIEAVLLGNGYIKGNRKNFDPLIGLDTTELFAFLKATQPKEWAKLEKSYGVEVEAKVAKYLRGEINRKGTIEVLRHGITDRGVKLRLAFMPPSSRLNPEVTKLYEQNRITITRQLPCTAGTNQTVDTCILVNGIPVVTIELKTPLADRTVNDAVDQYKARDQKSTVFGFKTGALVHFAVDPDNVFMTTKLEGKGTSFLPFNKGFNNGRGNPPNPKGCATAYLWEEVLQKKSLMDILAKFVQSSVETKRNPSGSISKIEKLLFPRYHQLDCVRSCVSHARDHGPGNNYLIQHSAGSGKTNSIAWLAHYLSCLHTSEDKVVFDSIIVVTDRIVLDDQLQSAISQFDHKLGVVQTIKGTEGSKSKRLAEALVAGKKIIIVTIQSFGFVLEQMDSMPGRNYAVIVDEAHSSQSGENATKMRKALGAQTEEEALATAESEQTAEEEAEDRSDTSTEEEVLKVLRARKRRPNMSFFAFTATPKAKTLEFFGTKNGNEKPRPFHLYSMRQAIEEGFILDVLSNYVTYETYWRIASSKSSDPEVEKKRASRAAVRFVQLHPYNIAQKVEIILDHYIKFTASKIRGSAKAMVVASSRKAAVRYKEAFDRLVIQRRIPEVRALVAFSGEVEDGGKTFTEHSMNGFPSGQIPEKFSSEDYQVLIVADKFQTGFDQPYLHTMFIDKLLSGVQAVQTLSRVNRTCPFKEDTFILDFVNRAEDIRAAFAPYYQETELAEEVDPNVLYRLKDQVMARGIIDDAEIEAVVKIAFKPAAKAGSTDHGLINSYVDLSKDRFKATDKSLQREFVGDLQSYLRNYAFLSQLVEFEDTSLEKLYVFSNYLLRKLPKTTGKIVDLEDDVRLTFYKNKKVFDGTLTLSDVDSGAVQGIGDATKKAPEAVTARLSTIIDVLNKKFGTDLTPEDQLTFDQVESDMSRDELLREQALVNDKANFRYPAREKISSVILNRAERNQPLCLRILTDEDFRNTIEVFLADSLYDRFWSESDQLYSSRQSGLATL